MISKDEKILRLPDVKAKVGLSTSSIYRLIKGGEFPRQIKLGCHASGWLDSQVQDWINNKSAQPADCQHRQAA